MPGFSKLRGQGTWIGIVYFLVAATPGFWFPVITNILKSQGWGHLVTWTFLVPAIAGLLSPLLMAARADQKIAAEKLLGILLITGSGALYMAFHELERGLHPERFLAWLAVTALITAPGWSLLTTITFTSVDRGKGSFGIYRVWATLGWMAAGWVVSSLALDTSALTGKLAVLSRLCAAACCFMLPHTPPKGGPASNWRDALGLRALKLLRERDIGIFLLVCALFSIPLAAFYMHTPPMLKELGVERVAATMTIGQISEVFAFIIMGAVMRRCRLKWLFVFAMACGLARYVLYAIASSQSSIVLVVIGISFHGLCWAFFYEAGKIFLDRRVSFAFRNQIQALMGLFSGNLGSIAGTLIAGALYGGMVVDGSPGWSAYWWLLSGMIVCCILVFVFGYRGQPADRPEE